MFTLNNNHKQSIFQHFVALQAKFDIAVWYFIKTNLHYYIVYQVYDLYRFHVKQNIRNLFEEVVGKVKISQISQLFYVVSEMVQFIVAKVQYFDSLKLVNKVRKIVESILAEVKSLEIGEKLITDVNRL